MRISLLVSAIFISLSAHAQFQQPVPPPLLPPPQIDPQFQPPNTLMGFGQMQQSPTGMPFVMPPDPLWRVPDFNAIPGLNMNPYFTGETTFAPPGQDPYTYDRFTLPVGTQLSETHERFRFRKYDNYSEVKIDELPHSSKDPKESGVDQMVGQTVVVATKDLATQTADGKGHWTVKKPLKATQQTAVQNDANSKISGGGRCILCEQAERNKNQEMLLETKLNAILASKQVPAQAFGNAKACFMRMLKEGKLANIDHMTFVDYNQPDSAERLYFIDLRGSPNGKNIVQKFKVAQGKNSSGPGVASAYALKYSNRGGSFETSSGCYLTGEKLPSSQFPYAVKMDGQDGCVNGNARGRTIEFHGWSGAHEGKDERVADTKGCFGVAVNVAAVISPAIANGSAFYAEPLSSVHIDGHTFKAVIEKSGNCQ